MQTGPITIATNKGPETVQDAYINGDFAFHKAFNKDKDIEDIYHVTHIPTGKNCTGGYALGPLAAAELRDHYAKLDIPEGANQDELAKILEKAFTQFCEWAGWLPEQDAKTGGDT